MNEGMHHLVDVLLDLDSLLPHEAPLPVNAQRPAWCHSFMERFGITGKDCCGVCPELSEVTVKSLDRAFASSS